MTMPITCKEAAARHGVLPRRIQKLAEAGRIPGASKHGSVWLIPDNFIVVAPPKRSRRKLDKIRV